MMVDRGDGVGERDELLRRGEDLMPKEQQSPKADEGRGICSLRVGMVK
jgi:hypothetical protein